MNNDPMMKPAAQLHDAAAPLFGPPTPAPADPAAAVAPEPTKCEKCDALMWFVKNVDTNKPGPVNAKTTVYVIDARTVGTDDQGRPQFEGMTGKNWLERVDRVLMKDGTSVPGSALIIGVSHFSTCPAANHFSKNKGR